MTALLERIRAYFAARSPRERWILLGGACVLLIVLIHFSVISPLSARLSPARAQVDQLESQFSSALRMSGDVRLLQPELEQVESRISSGEATDLFALLERLAAGAQVKDQLESIKPKQPSSNPGYPETRVEVQLKGATLEQTVRFLHEIETAPIHLIVRSIRIRTRPDGSQLLDVNFSVSSFVRT